MTEFIIFSLTILAAAVALFRHSVGVWLCVVLLPLSATHLVGRQMFGVTGLNPFNILLVSTLLSFMLACISNPQRTPWPRLPWIFWLYVLMFIVYGIVGCFFIHLAPAMPTDNGTLQRMSVEPYMLERIAKPLLVIIVAYLVAARAQAGHAKSLVWAVALGSGVMTAAVIGYVVTSGVPLRVLAGAGARGFLSWTGLHANSLGLFFNMSTALLLFTALSSRTLRGRSVLLVLAGGSAVASLLTFSRGTFLGLAVLGAYFILSRRRVWTFCLAFVLLAVTVIMLPQEFYMRATTGLEQQDAEALSAGRATVIWPALVPVFWESPLLGHGLSSTLWAKPNRSGLHFGHPHNAYLAALLDFGILGSIVIVAFFVSMWRRVRKFKVSCIEDQWRGMFEGVSVCILLLMAQGLTDDFFVPNFSHAWLWVGIGLAIGYPSTHSGRRSVADRARWIITRENT